MEAPIDPFVRATNVAENNAIKVLKWSLHMSRLIGYCPFSFGQDKRLTFSWWSWPTLYTLILFPATFVIFASQYDPDSLIYSYDLLSSPTAKYGFFFLSLNMMLFTYICKIRALTGARNVVRFWHRNIRFVARFTFEIQEFIGNIHDYEHSDGRNALRQLGSGVRYHVLFIILVSAAQFISVSPMFGGIHRLVPLALSIAIINFHTAYCQLQVLYPRLYTIMLKLMVEAIQGNRGHRRRIPYAVAMHLEKVGGATDHSEAGHEKSHWAVKQQMRRYNQPVLVEKLLNLIIRDFTAMDKLLDEYCNSVGSYLVLQAGLEILTILSYIFLAILWGNKGVFAFTIGCMAPVLLFGVELVVLTSAGSQLKSGCDALLNSLHALYSDDVSAVVHYKVRLLALKLSSCPLKVSAKGFFNLSNTLLVSVFAALTTYVIMLVQFQLADWNQAVQATL